MNETKAQQVCPYCHGHADLISNEDMLIYIKLEEYAYLCAEDDEYISHREIHYCPCCGRKLGDDY
ncbi:hypothetical protein IWT140_02212 [Secundilactobacillus pentosiphilus]|uniref:Uncharacterized protein n=1 Tax=Secundilactobacillus pentosiphilus TaxID=1714682 RepID=A0A1Z5IS58_9LACO|nr:hypothetical protein [Secundilactobacillus pentosiphilus]GAX04570.1 hypothetical protein IWT140_02212 [Secundilactobacillus pentosiphilus]